MSANGAASYVIVVLALLWLAVAIGLSMLAARRLRLAQGLLAAARSNAALLELTPARPLLVGADERIEIDPQLSRELGLRGQPSRLAELSADESGIVPDDLDALTQDIAVARASAGRIARRVKASASGRAFDVRGGSAPAPAPPGTRLVGVFANSAREEDRAKLTLGLRQTAAALNARLPVAG